MYPNPGSGRVGTIPTVTRAACRAATSAAALSVWRNRSGLPTLQSAWKRHRLPPLSTLVAPHGPTGVKVTGDTAEVTAEDRKSIEQMMAEWEQVESEIAEA